MFRVCLPSQISIRNAQSRKKPTNLCAPRVFLQKKSAMLIIIQSCYCDYRISKPFTCSRCVICCSRDLDVQRAQRIMGFYILVTHKSTRSDNAIMWTEIELERCVKWPILDTEMFSNSCRNLLNLTPISTRIQLPERSTRETVLCDLINVAGKKRKKERKRLLPPTSDSFPRLRRRSSMFMFCLEVHAKT